LIAGSARSHIALKSSPIRRTPSTYSHTYKLAPD
jgi:hypothetical protein